MLPATREYLGGVIVGDGLDITGDGVLSCTISAENIASIVAENIKPTTSSSTMSQKFIHTTSITTINSASLSEGMTPEQYLYQTSSNMKSYCYKLIETDDKGHEYFKEAKLILPAEFSQIDFYFSDSTGSEITWHWIGIGQQDYVPFAYKRMEGGHFVCYWDTANEINFNTATMMDSGVIHIGWVIESDYGNVLFNGTVDVLPGNPKHGNFVYKDATFYIYDMYTKNWLHL